MSTGKNSSQKTLNSIIIQMDLSHTQMNDSANKSKWQNQSFHLSKQLKLKQSKQMKKQSSSNASNTDLQISLEDQKQLQSQLPVISQSDQQKSPLNKLNLQKQNSMQTKKIPFQNKHIIDKAQFNPRITEYTVEDENSRVEQNNSKNKNSNDNLENNQQNQNNEIKDYVVKTPLTFNKFNSRSLSPQSNSKSQLNLQKYKQSKKLLPSLDNMQDQTTGDFQKFNSILSEKFDPSSQFLNQKQKNMSFPIKNSKNISEINRSQSPSTHYLSYKVHDSMNPNQNQSINPFAKKQFYMQSKENHFQITKILQQCQLVDSQAQKVKYSESEFFLQLMEIIAREKNTYQEALIFLNAKMKDYVICQSDQTYRNLTQFTQKQFPNTGKSYREIVDIFQQYQNDFLDTQNKILNEKNEQLKQFEDKIKMQEKIIFDLENIKTKLDQEYSDKFNELKINYEQEQKEFKKHNLKLNILINNLKDDANETDLIHKSQKSKLQKDYEEQLEKLSREKVNLLNSKISLEEQVFQLEINYGQLKDSQSKSIEALKVSKSRIQELESTIDKYFTSKYKNGKNTSSSTINNTAWGDLTPRPTLTKLANILDGDQKIIGNFEDETTQQKIYILERNFKQQKQMYESQLKQKDLQISYLNDKEKSDIKVPKQQENSNQFQELIGIFQSENITGRRQHNQQENTNKQKNKNGKSIVGDNKLSKQNEKELNKIQESSRENSINN